MHREEARFGDTKSVRTALDEGTCILSSLLREEGPEGLAVRNKDKSPGWQFVRKRPTRLEQDD